MKTECAASHYRSHYRVCHESCGEHLPGVQSRRSELENLLAGMEDATMPRVKQASKRKRVTKAAVPALGAAGLTFAMVGGASASAVPTDVRQTNNFSPTQSITLGEEEIADVSLATFYLFDKESTGSLRGMVQQARGGCGRGCGGCRGCRGCGGRGCGGRGCGCGGCVGCAGCCLSWGYCRLC
jgi:hypothetical protein